MECKLNMLTGYYSPMVLFITRPMCDSVTNSDYDVHDSVDVEKTVVDYTVGC